MSTEAPRWWSEPFVSRLFCVVLGYSYVFLWRLKKCCDAMALKDLCLKRCSKLSTYEGAYRFRVLGWIGMMIFWWFFLTFQLILLFFLLQISLCNQILLVMGIPWFATCFKTLNFNGSYRLLLLIQLCLIFSNQVKSRKYWKQRNCLC